MRDASVKCYPPAKIRRAKRVERLTDQNLADRVLPGSSEGVTLPEKVMERRQVLPFLSRNGTLQMQMNSTRFSTRRSVWRLRGLATVLALLGQLGISGASLALARDESSAVSHTERSGIDLHHGHNEATCVACASLSFHANVSAVAPPVSIAAIFRLGLASRASYCVTGAPLLPNSCRAPPREL
jgi:hypothetical protein